MPGLLEDQPQGRYCDHVEVQDYLAPGQLEAVALRPQHVLAVVPDAVCLPPVAQGDVYRVARRQPRAIGIVIPGIVFHSSGEVWAPNISGWDHYPLRDHLLEATETEVVLDVSDRVFAALGNESSAQAAASSATPGHAGFPGAGLVGAGLAATIALLALFNVDRLGSPDATAVPIGIADGISAAYSDWIGSPLRARSPSDVTQ